GRGRRRSLAAGPERSRGGVGRSARPLRAKLPEPCARRARSRSKRCAARTVHGATARRGRRRGPRCRRGRPGARRRHLAGRRRRAGARLGTSGARPVAGLALDVRDATAARAGAAGGVACALSGSDFRSAPAQGVGAAGVRVAVHRSILAQRGERARGAALRVYAAAADGAGIRRPGGCGPLPRFAGPPCWHRRSHARDPRRSRSAVRQRERRGARAADPGGGAAHPSRGRSRGEPRGATRSQRRTARSVEARALTLHRAPHSGTSLARLVSEPPPGTAFRKKEPCAVHQHTVESGEEMLERPNQVLVIDDDEAAREILVELLGRIGYHAFATGDGKAGLEWLAGAAAPPSRIAARRRGVPTEYVASSPAMLSIWDMVDRVAETDVPVLIRGESGVGKEGIARTLHERSPRRGKPFVKINCAALPSEL